MRLLTLSLTVLALAALPLIGCGNEETSSSATSLAPAASVTYGEVTLDPQGDQQQALDAIVSKFPGSGSAGQRLRSLVEQGLTESDAPINFKDDIEPWLGDEAAFFVGGDLTGRGPTSGAVLLATDDEDAARDAVDKAFKEEPRSGTYEDVDYKYRDGMAVAVFDDYVVIGTVAGVKDAIDASKDGPTLADDDTYTKAVAGASDDRLGLVYVNSPRIYDAMQRGTAGSIPLGQSLRDSFKDPYVATVAADSDGLTVEATIPASLAKAVPVFSPGSDLVGDMPADSWFALGQPNLGATLDHYLDGFAESVGGRDVVEEQFRKQTGLDLTRDVFGWMGDFGVFVSGTSVGSLGGALVVETKDPAASGRLIARLQKIVAASSDPGTSVGPLGLPGGGQGFTIRDNDIPQPVHVFQRDGRFVVAYGADAARDAVAPGQTLSSSPEFQEASKSLAGYDVTFFLSIEQVLRVAESAGAGSDADFQRAKPYLDPLAAVISGVKDEGGDIDSAVKVVVR